MFLRYFFRLFFDNTTAVYIILDLYINSCFFLSQTSTTFAPSGLGGFLPPGYRPSKAKPGQPLKKIAHVKKTRAIFPATIE
jgi:hypothetical protein